MLMQKSEVCVLYGAPAVTLYGEERRAEIGTVRAVLHIRSSEEVEEDGMSRSSDTVYAVIASRYAPPGGFRRGMELRDRRGDRYRMLTPVNLGVRWSIKCRRAQLGGAGVE